MFFSGSPAAGPSMSNPLTTQSQVVLNGRYDRYFTNYRKRSAGKKTGNITLASSVEDEVFDIMPREIAMALRQDYDAHITRPINYEKDREVRIFTSANGMPLLMDDAARLKKIHADMSSKPDGASAWKREYRALLREQLIFVGVPLTKVLTANQNQTDAVSVQVSGSVTIFNTGIYDIQLGDLVMWDIPYATTQESMMMKSKTAGGLPETKMSFWTVPMRMGVREDADMDGASARSIAHCTTVDIFHAINNPDTTDGAPAIKKRKRDTNKLPSWAEMKAQLFRKVVASNNAKANNYDTPEVDDALRNLLMYYSNASQRYGNRVIGIALSKARPGENFDILLQKSV